jgi:hypothetical protein
MNITSKKVHNSDKERNKYIKKGSLPVTFPFMNKEEK